MRKLSLVLSVGATMWATSACAQPESSAQRLSVVSFIEKMDRTVNTGTMDQFMALLTPDYTFVNQNGERQTKAQMRQMIESMIPSMRKHRAKSVVRHVQLQRQEASVWIEHTMTFEMKQGNRWVPQKHAGRFCLTLVRAGNSWKIQYEQELFQNEPWSFNTGG